MIIDDIKNTFTKNVFPIFSKQGFNKYIKSVLTKEGFNRYFVETVKNLYTNIDFNGRAGRTQYWYFTLFCFLIGIGAGILDGLLFDGFLSIIVALALLLPSLELAVRRIHDLGQPWFWILIGIIPYIGSIALLIWFCLPGEEKENQWGKPVKAD